MLTRALLSTNEATHRRLINYLKNTRNVLKLNVSRLTHLTGKANSLIKVEAILTDKRGVAVGSSFFSTECTHDDTSDTFETETCELQATVSPKSYKFLKLPVKRSAKDLRNYHLLFLVKIGETKDQHESRSTGRQSIFDLYREDRESYKFET